jgi:hypothetical protein
MELAKLNGPVSTFGGGEAINFKIAANAKMFRILSDNMYQDKIGSIVREISCNALDSHMMAGNTETPFLIHLPDQFEPWFTVRDYGTGMSPSMVKDVFCSYGESTKDQSNDSIGAFGLGAKTPFAYTDQFNIVSIFNGTMYAYSAFYNSDGLPEIVLMAETPTTEHNGVEIKLAVKPADFRRFHDAVRDQLRFFPVKPTVTNSEGDAEFNWHPTPKYLFESESVKIYQSHGYGTRAYIIQGPVGYPMDVNQVVTALTAEESSFLRTLVDTGVNFQFKIGEIGVTASREGVEYNTHTLASLKARIAAAYKEVKDWVESQIATLPNVYEKALFVNENSTFRAIINQVKLDLSPATKDPSGNYTFAIGSCPEFKVELDYTDMAGAIQKRTVNGISITEYTRSGLNGFTGSRNTSNDAHIRPRKDTKVAIVIRDAAKTPVAKMRHYFKENNLERMYALTPTYDTMVIDAAFVNALKNHLGGFANITLVSAMPDPPKTAYDRTRTDYSRPTAYRSNGSGHDDLDSVANWTRVYDKLGELTTDDGDDLEEAIYVTVDRQRVESLDYESKRLYADLCKAGVVDVPLFGIRENDVAKLAATDTKWIKLADYVKAKRDEVLANPNIKRYSVASAIQQIVEQAIGPRLGSLTGLHPRTSIARLSRVGERSKAIAINSQVNSHILRIAGYDAEKHPAIAVVRTAAKNMFDKIPMVQYVSRAGYGGVTGSEAEHVVAYINHFGVNR